MKLSAFPAAVFSLLIAAPVLAGDFSVALSDDAWDGETVPEGQQCQKFGGKPSTPPLSVSGIPEGANALFIEFNDTDYEPMSNGGHGKLGLALNSAATELEIPAVAGHTFDLPAGFFTVKAQQAPKWDLPGAYLAPCSGGKGNLYTVTVKAVRADNDGVEVLAKATINIGRF